MKTLSKLVIYSVLLAAATMANANSIRIFTLSADEWARPRNGAVIIELQPIRAAVNYWDQGSDSIIQIRYPGEDRGELWAAELKDWLISLGIPANSITLLSGTKLADEIKLVVGSLQELNQ